MNANIPVLMLVAVWLSACATQSSMDSSSADRSIEAAELSMAAAVAGDDTLVIQRTRHEAEQDLLTAGLGLAGLRQPAVVPDPANAATAAELRRLAMRSSWAGLTDLTVSGGFAEDASLPVVIGREFQALLTLPGRQKPVRVLLQLPDAFDRAQPCVLVTASSGSRGIYGGLPVAGYWGLPRGCAVAYTDKGAGTDFFDHASNSGVALDGTRVNAGNLELAFAPAAMQSETALVSVPHAHSQDHPEADWGQHVLLAAHFALRILNQEFDSAEPFTPERVRIVAVGLSNAGDAVLRAAEQAEPGLFDAVLSVAPNVTPPNARPLFDYATEAALYQPCLVSEMDEVMTMPLGNPTLLAAGVQRCQSLYDAGLIETSSSTAARGHLKTSGFSNAVLEHASINTGLDLWRSVAAMYASAYLRRSVDDMPCGYAVAVVDERAQPQPADEAQRTLWWSLSSGVVPGAGLSWIDSMASQNSADPSLPGLRCLRTLWTGDSEQARSLRAAVDTTRASAMLPEGTPVLIVHGLQDGLIPAEFSATAYVEAARANGADDLVYWRVDGAQHFDVLVPFPGMAARFRPLLPILWQGMDALWRGLDGIDAGPQDRLIDALAVE